MSSFPTITPYVLHADDETAESSFARDEVTDQLENRFSGQGHRARLQAQQAMMRANEQPQPYDRRRDAMENRVGEERMVYLQGRQANGSSNYVANSQPPMHGSGHPRGRSNIESTPRSFSGGFRQPDRGRVVSGPPNPNRAPSPRSFGTVRFGPGGQRLEQPTCGPASRPMTAPTQPRGMPNGLPAQPRAMPNGVHTQSQAMPNGTSAQGRPIAIPVSPRARLNGVASQAPPSSPMTVMSTQPTAAAATVNSKTGHTPLQELQYKTMAEWYATHPGEESDRYHDKFPDRLQYLAPVLRVFIRQCFILAKDPYGCDASDYLATHKDREWIWEAALQAKDFVENRAEAEGDAYYAAHPEFIEFYKGAKKNFKRKLSDSTEQVPAASRPAPQPAPASATTSTATTSTTTSVSSTLVASSPQSSLAPVTQPSAEASVASVAPNATAEQHPTRSAPPAAPAPRTANTQQPRRPAPPVAPARQTLPGAFPSEETPPRSREVSTRTSQQTAMPEPKPSSTRNTSARTSEETTITVPEPAPAPEARTNMNGAISAVFHNLARTFLRQGADPQSLIEVLDDVVSSLRGMAAGTTTANVARAGVGSARERLGGYRRTEDGLWESGDEEEEPVLPMKRADSVRMEAGRVGGARQTDDGLWVEE